MSNWRVLLFLGGIWLLLILASFFVYALTRLKPEKNYKELIQRTIIWWVMVAFFSFAFLSNRTIALIFLGFISFLALKEFFSMIPTRRADRCVLFWAYLAVPIQYYWAGIDW